MPRKLLELASVESPFVWRAKYALAHKGLTYETERVGFVDIPKTCGGRHATVPVLIEEDGTEIGDSWGIAAYLDDTYPDAPPLFSGTAHERAKEIDSLLGQHAFPAFFPLYIGDVLGALDGENAAYFRASREQRFGATIEQLCAGREAVLPDARAAIEPLRAEIAKADWLHGDSPGYGDYILLAFFAWIKAAATTPPLAAGDPLLDYIERGFALSGGIGTKLAGGPLA